MHIIKILLHLHGVLSVLCSYAICQIQRRLQYFKHFKSDKNTRPTVFRDFPQFPHNRSQTLLWTLVKSLTTQQEVWHSSKMSEITLMQIEAQSEFFPLAFHTSCSVWNVGQKTFVKSFFENYIPTVREQCRNQLGELIKQITNFFSELVHNAINSRIHITNPLVLVTLLWMCPFIVYNKHSWCITW